MSEEVGCGGRLVAVAEIAPDLLNTTALQMLYRPNCALFVFVSQSLERGSIKVL